MGNNKMYTYNEELNFQWRVEANNSCIICDIFFDLKQKPTHTTADNVPVYNFHWTSDNIYVATEFTSRGNDDTIGICISYNDTKT